MGRIESKGISKGRLHCKSDSDVLANLKCKNIFPRPLRRTREYRGGLVERSSVGFITQQ